MKNRMIHSLLLLVLAVISMVGVASPTRQAEAAVALASPLCQNCTQASLRGNYVYVRTAGANVAAELGVAQFDGAGHVSYSGILNQPADDGSRQVSPTGNRYVYSINSDGTGVFINADGHVERDFAVTHARPGLATGLASLQRPPGENGALVRTVWTRLPEGATFAPASLDGGFTQVGIIGVNAAGELARMYFDGHGNATSAGLLNAPTADGGRQIIQTSEAYTYTMSADGMGTLINVNGQVEYDIVIIHAEEGLAAEIVGLRRRPGDGSTLVMTVWTVLKE